MWGSCGARLVYAAPKLPVTETIPYSCGWYQKSCLEG